MGEIRRLLLLAELLAYIDDSCNLNDESVKEYLRGFPKGVPFGGRYQND